MNREPFLLEAFRQVLTLEAARLQYPPRNLDGERVPTPRPVEDLARDAVALVNALAAVATVDVPAPLTEQEVFDQAHAVLDTALIEFPIAQSRVAAAATIARRVMCAQAGKDFDPEA